MAKIPPILIFAGYGVFANPILLMGEEGLEPPRPFRPADFKSASSADSDTRPPIRSWYSVIPLPRTVLRPKAGIIATNAAIPAASDRDRTSPRQPGHSGGDGRIRTAESGFCRPLPCHLATSPRLNHNWSGRWDLNPRPSPWQGDALPLSYSRAPIYSLGPVNYTRCRAGRNRMRALLS